MHDPDSFEPNDTELLDDENPDLRQEIIDTVGEDWLCAKNVMLGNKSPAELINTPEEMRVRDMLRSFVVAALS